MPPLGFISFWPRRVIRTLLLAATASGAAEPASLTQFKYEPQQDDACASARHLLALQKAVLLAISDLKALEQVIAIDSQLPSGCYKRAWTLVNSNSDSYLQYVAEISQ